MKKRLNFRRGLADDNSGLATIEFALASTALLVGLLNGLEVARWSYQKMEVANAVHSATLAVWNACDTKHLPALKVVNTTTGATQCSGVTSAISTGLQTTSIGTAVTLATGYPTEGYYCVNSTSGALANVANFDEAKPSTCSAQGDSTHSPGDYLVVRANYTYTPMFPRALTVGAILPTDLTSTGYIRLK